MNQIRAEFLKLLTLPAVALTVTLTWVVTVVVPLSYARTGFVVFGILAATSEYEGGQVRTTLLAVPRRLDLVLAKTFVLAVTILPVAVVTVLIAGEGNPAYLLLITLLAAAVGTILRNALAAVVLLLSYFGVLGPILGDRISDSLWLPVAWTAGVSLLAAATFVGRDA
ncbi:hypothetical protein [Actinoplanes friuliensis]|uniref:ABC transporter permease n=1 Tax=Actinoplanes friuliensis DSM 7358 TaxID=1246995 RepID=U5W097_9ACTN|nr:hypothetical protein [Actinoplanes friuliensis]AGZ42457.1 hypothetical protein AFR_20925 [Actinoplanes friuliensis DSM 7358]